MDLPLATTILNYLLSTLHFHLTLMTWPPWSVLGKLERLHTGPPSPMLK